MDTQDEGVVMTDYDHITITEPVRWYEMVTPWRIENKFNYTFKKILQSTTLGKYFINIFLSFMKIGVGYFESCNDIEVKEQIHRKSLELLDGDISNAQAFKSEYGYEDDIHEFALTLMNYQLWKNGFSGIKSESPVVFDQTLSTISEILNQDPAINSFLNFGVSYGNVDADLSNRYPDVKFVGIDRSKLTKTFNEIRFGNIRNLEFVAGDIFEYLSKNSFHNGIFFTSRTMMIFPKEFVEKLYSAVKKAGFVYIVGLEPIGISRQTGKPYIFSDTDQQSVVYTNKMFIHNYPAILQKFGYSVLTTELIKTNNGHKDFRIIKYIGKLEKAKKDYFEVPPSQQGGRG